MRPKLKLLSDELVEQIICWLKQVPEWILILKLPISRKR